MCIVCILVYYMSSNYASNMHSNRLLYLWIRHFIASYKNYEFEGTLSNTIYKVCVTNNNNVANLLTQRFPNFIFLVQSKQNFIHFGEPLSTTLLPYSQNSSKVVKIITNHTNAGSPVDPRDSTWTTLKITALTFSLSSLFFL